MAHYTKQEIIEMIEEEDVEFIRLQFVDIYGIFKNMAVTASQLERVLNNEMTLKFGLVTFGSLNDKELILDLERVNLLNSVQSNDIKVSLMDRNVLVSNSKVIGKNDAYYSVTVYNTLFKA